MVNAGADTHPSSLRIVDHPYVMSYGGFQLVMGVPPKKMDGLFHGKSQSKMDDWGYPKIRKPPYISHDWIAYICLVTIGLSTDDYILVPNICKESAELRMCIPITAGFIFILSSLSCRQGMSLEMS